MSTTDIVSTLVSTGPSITKNAAPPPKYVVVAVITAIEAFGVPTSGITVTSRYCRVTRTRARTRSSTRVSGLSCSSATPLFYGHPGAERDLLTLSIRLWGKILAGGRRPPRGALGEWRS